MEKIVVENRYNVATARRDIEQLSPDEIGSVILIELAFVLFSVTIEILSINLGGHRRYTILKGYKKLV